MDVRKVGEVVAAISVVLSLVFVGLEIRNNTAVALAESRRAATAENIDFIMRVQENETLRQLNVLPWDVDVVDSLSPADQSAIFNLAIAHTIRLENVYLQAQLGFLDESAFGTYGMGNPQVRGSWYRRFWYRTYRPLLEPSFVEYFEGRHGFRPSDTIPPLPSP